MGAARAPPAGRDATSGNAFGWASAIRLTPCARRCRKSCHPSCGRVEDDLVGADAGHEGLHHGVEELLLARDVAVQRHRLDAELLPEPTHGEAGQAVGVDELQRGLDDPVATEGDPRRRRRLVIDRSPVRVGVAVRAGELVVGLGGRCGSTCLRTLCAHVDAPPATLGCHPRYRALAARCRATGRCVDADPRSVWLARRMDWFIL